jgi:hypothetical protein
MCEIPDRNLPPAKCFRLTADYSAKRFRILRLAKCSMTCRDGGFFRCVAKGVVTRPLEEGTVNTRLRLDVLHRLVHPGSNHALDPRCDKPEIRAQKPILWQCASWPPFFPRCTRIEPGYVRKLQKANSLQRISHERSNKSTAMQSGLARENWLPSKSSMAAFPETERTHANSGRVPILSRHFSRLSVQRRFA